MLFNSLLDPAPARTWQSRAELHFEWSEPPWFERYRARLPRCHFDASANRIRCDAALLDEPIGTANAQTAQMIVQQCDAELARLGYAESIVERVRNLLICGAHGYPSVDDVARELHVSTRTLAQARGIRRNLFGAARRNPAARRCGCSRARNCRSTRSRRGSATPTARISRARSSVGPAWPQARGADRAGGAARRRSDRSNHRDPVRTASARHACMA
jgi:hypothetical protein